MKPKVLQEGPWHCDKDHLYTQCACHAAKGRLGISGSFLGSWFPPSLFPTSDSFTAGRPWEKSLRRRNSSQFGQCKALKASSIVFSNAALTAVVIILHSQNRQKSRFPQPLVEESQMNNSTSSIRCISFRKTYLLYFPGQWVGELSKY